MAKKRKAKKRKAAKKRKKGKKTAKRRVKKKAKRKVKRKVKRKGAKKKAKKKAPKRKKKKAAKKKKKAKRKKKAKKKKKKRKPNPAFMRPLQASAALQAVIGSKPLPRSGVVKKLWAYIRKHGLQDQKNRRMINADANLKAVFRGKSQVNMFEMNKLVSKHLT